MFASSLKDLTIVIPAHNAPLLLRRTLHFLLDFPGQILVLDSSNEGFEFIRGYDIKYQWMPEKTYSEKLAIGSRLIETRYAVICCHDDFLLSRGLEESVSYLNKNPSVVACNGGTIVYSQKYTYPMFLSYFQRGAKHDLCAENALDRLEALYSNFTHLVYAVVRTDIFRNATELSNKFNVKDVCVTELLTAGYYALSGEVKFKGTPLYVQEHFYHSVGATLEPTYVNHPGNEKDHIALEKALMETATLAASNGSEHIEETIKNMLRCFQDSLYTPWPRRTKKLIYASLRRLMPIALIKCFDMRKEKKLCSRLEGNICAEIDEVLCRIDAYETDNAYSTRGFLK